MALILNIETSSQNCSVALAKDTVILGFKEIAEGYTHIENLHVFINDIIKKCNVSLNEIDAFAVGAGPGSYTGLRIGVSAAKGFCYALNKPLIAINSLQIIASNFLKNNIIDDNSLLVPMIDARRMEIYTAIFDTKLNIVEQPSAKVIDENSFIDYHANAKKYCFGDGAKKCEIYFGTINNFELGSPILPSAADMCKLSEKNFDTNLFENVAYFEPYYLKEFYTNMIV